jgi:hypothetical protein
MDKILQGRIDKIWELIEAEKRQKAMADLLATFKGMGAIPAAETHEQIKAIDEEVTALKGLVGQSGMSATSLDHLWQLYHDKRIIQIANEADKMRGLGADAAVVAAIVKSQTAEIDRALGAARFQAIPQGPTSDLGGAERIKAHQELIADVFKWQHEMALQARNDEVAMLHDVVTEVRDSRDKRLALWSQYYDARLAQINAEAKALENAGVAGDIVTATRLKEIRDLNAEIFMAQLSGLKGFVYGLSQELTSAFEDSFFRVLKGDFKNFYDVIQSITDVFLRRISQMISERLADALGFGVDDLARAAAKFAGGSLGGGSPLGDYNIPDTGGPVMAQHGGVFTRPTFAMVGEAGPEAVVPLDRMKQDAFWRRMGKSGVGAGGPSVTVNVHTPDVAGFKNSQMQIATAVSAALRAAQRNQ